MNTAPTLQPRSVLELLDAAFRVYRQEAGPIVRLLTRVVVSIAVVQLLVQANQRQFDPATLIPLHSQIVIDFVAALESGLGVSFAMQWYGGRLVYYVLTLVVVCRSLLDLLVPAVAQEPDLGTNAGVGYGTIFPGVLLAVPTMVLTAVGVNMLRDTALTSNIVLQSNNLANMPLVWQQPLVDHAAALLLCLVLVALAARLAVAAPAAAIEGLAGRASIRRSLALTHGHWWRAFSLSLLLAAIGTVIITLPIITLTIAIDPLLALPNSGIFTSLATVLSQVAEALLLPLQFAALVVLYYDLRVRVEGYDLQKRIECLATF